MRTYTFDGYGINGADEYKSRLATLTDEGHAQNIGNLFAASPELLAALESVTFIAESMAHLRGMESEILPYTDKARAAIAKVKG